MRAVQAPAGPATKNILRGIARHHGMLSQFENTLRGMLDAGTLVMYGERRGALYGLPKYRPSRRKHA